MKTIIFFYRKRNLQEPEIDAGIKNKASADEYRLIRVGLNLEGETWFGQNVGQTVQEREQDLLETEESEPPVGRGPLGILRRKRWEKQERLRREEACRRLEQLLFMREEQRKETEGRMQRLAAQILERAGEEEECRYVCEDFLKRSVAWQAWNRYFPVKEFDGYATPFWARQLLRYGTHFQFVILGVSDGAYELIESCARRMKGVRWLLREQDCTQELMDFVESFCAEYGLAITLRTLAGRGAYRKMRLSCPEPVNVLDFSGEDCISTQEIARGSVWLDMGASEEKRRRIAGRSTGILYFSLKEEWRDNR